MDCYHSTPAPRYPWKFEDFCLRAKINLDCLRSRGIEQSNLLWCDWRCIKSESVARCFGDKTEHPKTLHWPWLRSNVNMKTTKEHMSQRPKGCLLQKNYDKASNCQLCRLVAKAKWRKVILKSKSQSPPIWELLAQKCEKSEIKQSWGFQTNTWRISVQSSQWAKMWWTQP